MLSSKSSKGGTKKLGEAFLTSASNVSIGDISISEPQKSWTVTMFINFSSKEDALDFIEEKNMLKNPDVVDSFKRAAEESTKGKARPMEELFKKYGV